MATRANVERTDAMALSVAPALTVTVYRDQPNRFRWFLRPIAFLDGAALLVAVVAQVCLLAGWIHNDYTSEWVRGMSQIGAIASLLVPAVIIAPLIHNHPRFALSGAATGIAVSVTGLLLVNFGVVEPPPPSPPALPRVACAPPLTTAVTIDGTPRHARIWVSFGCPPRADDQRYWLMSVVEDSGEFYPLKDIGSGSKTALFVHDVNDLTARHCYQVFLTDAASQSSLGRPPGPAGYDLDQLPGMLEPASACISPGAG
jgi:hypothetical protein